MHKDISFLTSLKFKPVKKDRLFYDQFHYCLGFHLSEASCLRVLDHAHIDDLIERRKQWREIAQQRWKNGRRSHATIMSKRWQEITAKTSEDLHAVAKVLLATTDKFKLVVSINQAWVYSNELTLLNQLDQMSELNYKIYTQAQVVRPKNTIQLKNPQYQFRTYFKLTKLSYEQKDHLMDFLYNQRDHVRTSPALQRWIDQPFNRMQDYFFVDHDSELWLTMLNLVTPGIIRKTMHIIPAK